MDLATRRRTKTVVFQGVPLALRELCLRDYIRLLEIVDGIIGSKGLADAFASGSNRAPAIALAAKGFPDAIIEIIQLSTKDTGPIYRKWFGLLGRWKISREAILSASPAEGMALVFEILELNDVLATLKKKLSEAGVPWDRTPSIKPLRSAAAPTATAPSTFGSPSPAGA